VNFATDALYVGPGGVRTPLSDIGAGLHSPRGNVSSEVRHLGCHHNFMLLYGGPYPLGAARNVSPREVQVFETYQNLSTFTVVIDRMLAKEPGRCEFAAPTIVKDDEERWRGADWRKVCTDKERLDSIDLAQSIFDRVKSIHPEWKPPSLLDKSLVKRLASQWIG